MVTRSPRGTSEPSAGSTRPALSPKLTLRGTVAVTQRLGHPAARLGAGVQRWRRAAAGITPRSSDRRLLSRTYYVVRRRAAARLPPARVSPRHQFVLFRGDDGLGTSANDASPPTHLCSRGGRRAIGTWGRLSAPQPCCIPRVPTPVRVATRACSDGWGLRSQSRRTSGSVPSLVRQAFWPLVAALV